MSTLTPASSSHPALRTQSFRESNHPLRPGRKPQHRRHRSERREQLRAVHRHISQGAAGQRYLRIGFGFARHAISIVPHRIARVSRGDSAVVGKASVVAQASAMAGCGHCDDSGVPAGNLDPAMAAYSCSRALEDDGRLEQDFGLKYHFRYARISNLTTEPADFSLMPRVAFGLFRLRFALACWSFAALTLLWRSSDEHQEALAADLMFIADPDGHRHRVPAQSMAIVELLLGALC